MQNQLPMGMPGVQNNLGYSSAFVLNLFDGLLGGPLGAPYDFFALPGSRLALGRHARPTVLLGSLLVFLAILQRFGIVTILFQTSVVLLIR